MTPLILRPFPSPVKKTLREKRWHVRVRVCVESPQFPKWGGNITVFINFLCNVSVYTFLVHTWCGNHVIKSIRYSRRYTLYSMPSRTLLLLYCSFRLTRGGIYRINQSEPIITSHILLSRDFPTIHSQLPFTEPFRGSVKTQWAQGRRE